ncbi:hypothetical protein F0231_20810 [Vibrio sp. RE86]|nr:hypothetical protein [Vibrio sp. RE86]
MPKKKKVTKSAILGLISVCFGLGFRVGPFSFRIGGSAVLASLLLDSLFLKLVHSLKARSVNQPFQVLPLVLTVRILLRCKFHVVSVTVALKLRLTWFFQST